MAAITRQKGGSYYYATNYGFPPGFGDYVKSVPLVAGWGTVVGRVLLEGKIVHVHDVLADPSTLGAKPKDEQAIARSLRFLCCANPGRLASSC
jgi:hypothetical protein